MTQRKRAIAARLVLAGAIVAAGYAATPHPSTSVARAQATRLGPRDLAASLKPDLHGADGTNSGTTTATGPAILPVQTFSQQLFPGAFINGIELDASGNIIASQAAGVVASYQPNGTLNWRYPASGTGSGGFAGDSDPGIGAAPVVGSDGNVYIGDNTGALLQIPNTGGSAGVPNTIFSTVAANGWQETPKLGPGNKLYIGDEGGSFYRLSLGAGTATADWTFAAPGSTGSTAPFKFYGEAALDSAGNVYVTSSDTPSGGGARVGSLYKITPSGTEDTTFGGGHAVHLNAESVSTVVLAPVPTTVTPSGLLVIVADKFPEVKAFDSVSGAQVWQFQPTNSAAAIYATPAIANGNVYIANSADSLYILNLTTGAQITGSPVAVSNGARGSAIADAAGNVFLGTGSHKLNAYSPTGTLLWTLTTSGTSGNFYVPAIGSDGTIYAGGNVGTVTGYKFDAAGATAAAQTSAAQTSAAQTSAAQTSAAQTSAAQTSAAQTSAAQTANAAASATSAAQTSAAQTANASANNTATAAAAQTGAAQTSAAQTSAAQTASAQQTSAVQTSAAQTANAAASATSAAQTASALAAQQTAAAQTASAQQTSAAQTAAAGGAPNGQLYVLPNPETVQQGGSEAVLFKALPNSAITATIVTTATYPTTATLYFQSVGNAGQITQLPGTMINGTPVANGYQFTFSSGPYGRALLDFPIPANAPIEKVQVNAAASEPSSDKSQPLTQTAVFNVEAAQASSFGNKIKLARHHILIRTPELPTHAESVVHDNVKIVTAPGAAISVTAAISGPASSLGTGVDDPASPGDGTPFSNGQIFFTATATANAKGIATITLPISSTLLIPGKGGTIKLTVRSVSGSGGATYRTSIPVRENRLRLVLQPKETTRGNKRQVFTLGHTKTGTSTFSLLVLADQGAHISGSVTFPGTPPTVLNATGSAGPGGRVTLKFAVPNSVAAGLPHGTHGTATATVTSTFRGATITRTIHFTYAQK